MEKFMFVVIAIAVLAVFIYVLFFTQNAILRRKLKQAISSKISEFKDGERAKIVGEVILLEKTLSAPLSGRKCAFYYVHVEKRVSSSKNTSWRTIIEEEVSTNFLVKDEEHFAYVSGSNVECYIVNDHYDSSGLLSDPTVQAESYLRGKGYQSEGFLGFNKTLRFNEGVLEENERIAVLGKGTWRNAKDLNLPAEYGKVLEITSDGNNPIYLSDDPSTTLMKAKKAEKKKRKTRYNRDAGEYRK